MANTVICCLTQIINGEKYEWGEGNIDSAARYDPLRERC